MSHIMVIMAIKRNNHNPSVGGYSPNDKDRPRDQTPNYGKLRYQGTVDEKFTMLERDLVALERRVFRCT